jgi:hypothetical protein
MAAEGVGTGGQEEENVVSPRKQDDEDSRRTQPIFGVDVFALCVRRQRKQEWRQGREDILDCNHVGYRMSMASPKL